MKTFTQNNTMQILTKFSQKQSVTFMKIQGQTYKVIDDTDWIGLSFNMSFKTRYHTSK